MEHLRLYYAIALFIASIIYGCLGVYIITNNARSVIHRVFMGFCVSLSFWALGFSLSLSAADSLGSGMWVRLAALGWASSFSLLLHFILLLTGKDAFLKTKNYWWLYLPSLILVYFFVLFPQPQIPFDTTGLPWSYMGNSVVNGAFIFHYVYYAGYSLAVLLLVNNWSKNAWDYEHKKQSRLVLGSILITFVVASFTDVINASFIHLWIPQMAPLLILLPIYVMFESIRNHGFMDIKRMDDQELILNHVTRASIYQNISTALVIGSCLNFISQYFIYGVSFNTTLYLSIVVFFAAIMIFALGKSNWSDDAKDNVLIMAVSVLIPVVTIRFVQFGSITIWAFPFIFLLLFVLFNKRIMLIAASVSIITTQIMVWIMMPTVQVTVEGSDHIIRIGLFLIGIWAALYANKIYVLRLKENADQSRMQKMVIDISSDFITASEANLEGKMGLMLERAAMLFQCPLAFSCYINPDGQTISCTNGPYLSHDWSRLCRWGLDQFQTRSELVVTDQNDPCWRTWEQAVAWPRQDIKSVIMVPIVVDSQVKGIMGCVSLQSNVVFTEKHLHFWRIIANVLADAFLKVKAEQEQHIMAYFDQLTGLPNRILFKERAAQSLSLAARDGAMMGIIFLDLDSFKNINDTLGHEEGDKLLNTVAQELVGSIRLTDTVARYGGDEFLILVNKFSEKKDLIAVVERIMRVFDGPFILNGQEFFVTSSAGVAVYPIDGIDVDNLVKNADIAMYKAKEQGKNQYAMCSSHMKEETQRIMHLTNRLYQAMEYDELLLYYQPQIDMKSKTIVGMEALLRWNQRDLGMIYPNVFIPLAEKTGLINPIGHWVLQTACRQNRLWQDMGYPDLRIAVNLSAVQFRNPRLVDQVAAVLDETGMNPKYLDLEITESVAIKEPTYIVKVLNALKKLGVCISIDDFGTEYSSLSRLKSLPVDRIKMDMIFTQGIEGSAKDRAIAKVIINLAKSLGLKVVAEGVETALQLDFLHQRMCDEVQGYYYFRPMPDYEVEALLKSGEWKPSNSFADLQVNA